MQNLQKKFALSPAGLCFIVAAITLISFSAAFAQQVPDYSYVPPAFSPRYPDGSGSIVVMDEAHNNMHTADGHYAPFAKVLSADGYKIKKGKKHFSEKSLKDVKILVIANAINAANLSHWALPTPSAFGQNEIDIVQDWVKNGGSLFLIADHMPFPGAGADLAKAFGFTFYNGFAINPATYKLGLPDIFSRKEGTFQSKGLSGLDNVDSIATFMGQGFTIPPEATSILNLDEHFIILLPSVAWKFDKTTDRVSGQGKSQLACLKYGKGRVLMSGEAGMFTAQKIGEHKFGMNVIEGAQNYLLLLSLIHWLDGIN
jgi:hypothetical protein